MKFTEVKTWCDCVQEALNRKDWKRHSYCLLFLEGPTHDLRLRKEYLGQSNDNYNFEVAVVDKKDKLKKLNSFKLKDPAASLWQRADELFDRVGDTEEFNLDLWLQFC